MSVNTKHQYIFPMYIFFQEDELYHENGTPLAFAYYQENGTPVYYFYETNLQGDVVAIYDANGNKVVSFTYDAWGNFTATVVNTTVCTNFFIEATLFRYRGYIYDYESGLYYLQSRYYDYEIGRFINADGYINANGDLVGYNMYAYCSNNPVMYIDPTGDACHCLFERAHPRHKHENIPLETNTYEEYLEYKWLLENISYPKMDSLTAESNIQVNIYFSSMEISAETYTKWVIYAIEKNCDGCEFLGENKIDSKQLYGEIKGHKIVWDCKLGDWADKANPANINIYSDGSVVDSRPVINIFSHILGGTYHED